MNFRNRLGTQRPGYEFTTGRVLAIFCGLMIVVFLSALDQTIVATALPVVSSDLHGHGSTYAAVVTAYLLGMTVTVPIFGKLGDKYGRRPVFLAAISIFLIGSSLCGAAWSMSSLIAFRFLQGIGAGGLFPLAMAAIAAIVPPVDRGRFQGFVAGAYGAATVSGPAAGGFIVDHASWRWIFLVNLPLGLLGLGVILVTMPRGSVRHARPVDWAGAATLAVGATGLLLGVQWCAQSWDSPRVFAAFAFAIVGLVAFWRVERAAADPVLAFGLLRDRVYAASLLCYSLVAVVLISVATYVPLFVQAVDRLSATTSGVATTPVSIGAVLMSIFTGQWIARTGRYRANVLFGPLLLTFGTLMLTRLAPASNARDVVISMFVVGLGIGSMMSVFQLSAQNVVPVADLGAATASLHFARWMASMLGVVGVGLIATRGLSLGASGSASVRALDRAHRAHLSHNLHAGFLVCAALALLTFVIALVGVPARPLKRSVDTSVAAEAATSVVG